MVTNGQIGQSLHFFIPGIFLLGLTGGGSGTLALTSLSHSRNISFLLVFFYCSFSVLLDDISVHVVLCCRRRLPELLITSSDFQDMSMSQVPQLCA